MPRNGKKKTVPLKRRGEPRVFIDIEKEIGARIRLARLAKNMSQQDLGSLFGLSFQQIQKYEKGTNRVAGSRIVQLGVVLDVTPHQLLGWEKPEVVSLIDSDIYQLAKEFMEIPKAWRPHVQRLIGAIIAGVPK
jgi:transcriptional regulator with XRE-family HTH domain